MIAATILVLTAASQTNVPDDRATKSPHNIMLEKCTAQVGWTDEDAIYNCADNDLEYQAAQESCIAKHKDENGEEDDVAIKSCLGIVDATNMPLEDLKEGISARHPMDYYTLAGRLFQAGEKNTAVFWYYAGRLRWRARMSCVSVAPDGEGALSGALNSMFGSTFVEYIGGYPSRWSKTIRAAAEWDKVTPDNFDHGKDCSSFRVEQRKAVVELADYIDENREEIAKGRAENGLSNFETGS